MDAKRPWLTLLGELFQPLSAEAQERHWRSYADLLVDLGLADRSNVDALLSAPPDPGKPFPRLATLLIDRGVLDRAGLSRSIVAEAGENPESWIGPYVRTFPLSEESWDAWDTLRRVWVEFSLVTPEQQARLKERSRVAHPSLVRILDLGTLEDRPYIAVEKVQGVRLGSMPRQDRRRLLEAGRDAALAIAALHAKKVTHGAVSLKTLVIDETNATRLTGWGPGTDDVRDLAAALYELLTDRPAPASGPPKAWPRRLDDTLQALFKKALGKRPPTAAAFAASLTRVLAGG